MYYNVAKNCTHNYVYVANSKDMEAIINNNIDKNAFCIDLSFMIDNQYSYLAHLLPKVPSSYY